MELVFIAGAVLGAFIIAAIAYYAGRKHKQIVAAIPALSPKNHTSHQDLEITLEDPITQLAGWKIFEDRLAQNIKESERYRFVMGVIYVDINNFKMINNALGFEAGNLVLKEVARRLTGCIRQVDSMSRLAKDTFVLAITQLAKPETAAVITQRILQSLGEPINIEGHELYLTVSIGITIYPADASDAVSLLRSAEHALHLAKKKGKHTYQFYQEKMHADSQRELSFYTALSSESIFKEFKLFYQPIVNVRDESIACLDALLHWESPESGLTGPDDLALLMERQHKANHVTEWLLQTACKQYLHWHSLGFSPALLGIPISIRQLENSHFIYRISLLLQKVGFKPEWLLLEIKESGNQPSFDVLEKTFNMLNYMGINIAIDHFGVSAYSLWYLKNFSIHYLKLDQSLIADIEHNPKTLSLVESMVFLAKSMAIEVIVTGVEDDKQLAILRELGCYLMQGQQLGAIQSKEDITATIGTSAS